MIAQPLKFAALLAIAGLVSADCDLHNTMTEPTDEVETREALCKPQGADSWTFAMDVSEVAVPTFNGGNALAGVAGNRAFIVYDNYCVPKGIYSPDNEGNDCGIPWWINDIGLPYDIKITSVNTDVGDGYFNFGYSDGAYMIGENGATCGDLSDGLEAEVGCKTGFPVNG
ncbi:hypothetical protein FE257_008867 [Aspergillus nanangensis]|uniref:Uncharacterized protein n=1 Tax=Aspergillus nanangensis TaxID=2582783 RepID=A0AAD4CKP0_ASPNN|nr:hypothetical protein FE257_008867 [Aspergillus nanangensis]